MIHWTNTSPVSNNVSDSNSRSNYSYQNVILLVIFLILVFLYALFSSLDSFSASNEMLESSNTYNSTAINSSNIPTYHSFKVDSYEDDYLDKILANISRIKSDIAFDWNISSYPLFLNSFHVPKVAWDIQRSKFIKLMLQSNNIKRFTMGFTGSSVTAGHDNFFFESYPFIVKNQLQTIFTSLNITFQVLNHAIGNNPVSLCSFSYYSAS